MRTLVDLVAKINATLTIFPHWDDVAIACSITTKDGRPNPGLAWRIQHGYVPKTIELCNRLGIPALALAPVCPIHNVVHAGTCPKTDKPLTKKILADRRRRARDRAELLRLRAIVAACAMCANTLHQNQS